MKEGDKKMEMMALMLQDLTKESLAKNSVQPHAVEGHYDGNREIEDKKEGESDQDTPQTNPRVDRTKQLLNESSMFNKYFTGYVGFT